MGRKISNLTPQAICINDLTLIASMYGTFYAPEHLENNRIISQ
jgi:hypothetical protein